MGRLTGLDRYGNGFCICIGPLKLETTEHAMYVTENCLAYTRWECKYHVVFIPTYKKKAIFNNLRNVQDERFREFAIRKEGEIPVGHAVNGHVRMLACIPPKYSVSQIVGGIKGWSAIGIAWNYYG